MGGCDFHDPIETRIGNGLNVDFARNDESRLSTAAKTSEGDKFVCSVVNVATTLGKGGFRFYDWSLAIEKLGGFWGHGGGDRESSDFSAGWVEPEWHLLH